jgi:tryptophan synthase alpha chain
VKRGSGFIYYVSREGVTGMQQKVAADLAEMAGRIRSHTSLPVAVGFGISTPEQAKLVASCSDAVVIGSAIVNQVAAQGQSPKLVEQVRQFVEPLLRATKS